jgi:hypothetical protein
MKYLFVLCLSWALASAQDTKDIIQAFDLLALEPFYSVNVTTPDGIIDYDYIAPDKLRYHAVLNDGAGNTSQAWAIKIGNIYWDKFMDGSWNQSTVETNPLDELEFFDENSIEDTGILDNIS